MRLSINTAEIVYARIGTLEERVDAERCLERVKALDPGLWFALDAVIGAIHAPVLTPALWPAGKLPKRLRR